MGGRPRRTSIVSICIKGSSKPPGGLFALSLPVRPGVFDDGRELSGQARARLWGAYGQTQPLELGRSGDRGRKHGFDLYYLGVEQGSLAFIQGTGDEIRHSIGTRWWSQSAGFMHEVEGTYQLGTSQDTTMRSELDIEAWTVAGSMSYTFHRNRFALRMSLSGGVQSGDTDLGDGTMGTYRAPFPNLRWAGVATRLGPGNGVGGSFGLGMKASSTHAKATSRAAGEAV